MRALYTSSALVLMFGLAAGAHAAGTSAGQQSADQQMQHATKAQQQAGQAQQQAKGQQAAGYDAETEAFRSLDRNQDGRISGDETRAHRERIFSALDRDRDGSLSRQEVGGITAVEPGYIVITRMIPVAVTADVGSQMLSQMDQDQNRQVSRQEYMHYGEQQFKKAQEQAGGQVSATRTPMDQGQTGQPQDQQAQTGQGQQTQMGQQAQTGQQTQMGQQAKAGQSQQAGPDAGRIPSWQDVVRWREADVDQNGDGIVSSDEAASAWSQTFNELDQNGNNQLSQDELNRIRSQRAMVDERFANLDANGDGHISKDEFTNAGDDLMQQADYNQDGDVTAWEYRALRITDL